MNKQAVNTFKEGLVMDLNPLANDNKSLTNALNATFITLNGNELMLQNDMGNGRINRVRLDDGYIPVGIKEYGGIIYIASYNPETKKGQVGSFPYPKLEWEGHDFSNEEIPLNSLFGQNHISVTYETEGCSLDFYEILDDSVKIPLLISADSQEQLKVRSGDSFSIIFDEDTVQFLKNDNIKVKLVVKTSTNYYTISEDKDKILEGYTFIYGGSYSGNLYLQINLNIPDVFELDYIVNGNNIQVIPTSYNSNEELNTISHDAVAVVGNNTYSNITCTGKKDYVELLKSNTEICKIYPVTSDRGYIKNLERRIIFPSENLTQITLFRYYYDDNNILKLLIEYWYKLGSSRGPNAIDSADIVYRFYPIESIKNYFNNNSINSLHKTNNQILEIYKTGYSLKSGLRYLETELPRGEIYLLTVSFRGNQSSLNTLLEEFLFSRFVYTTPRYNKYYIIDDNTTNPQYDYNNIDELDLYIPFNLNEDIFTPKLEKITNYHYYGDDDTFYWKVVDNIVKYSNSSIPPSEWPRAFKSSLEVSINKTTEDFVECTPHNDDNYILDSDVFNIPVNDVNVLINTVLDIPLKNSDGVLLTDLDNNSIASPVVENSKLLFYRYISCLNNDREVQQTRTIKTLAPVFDPNTSYDYLLGYTYDDLYLDAVIASKKFLSNSCWRLCNVYLGNSVSNKPSDYGTEGFSFLSDQEESLTSGSVKLSNLLAAIETHSTLINSLDGPAIFDIFAGGNRYDGTGFRHSAEMASLAIGKSINNSLSGIDPYDGDEIDELDNWNIATCLNIKGKPIPINIAGKCYNKIFDSGSFVGPYFMDNKDDNNGSNSQQNEIIDNYSTKYPILTNTGISRLYRYIAVSKKLQCLLSQIFTLLNLERELYLVGPSSNNINYNILDNSYFLYKCSLKEGVSNSYSFTSLIDSTLKIISDSLTNSENNLWPKIYITSVKSTTINLQYNYGNLVNLGSSLYKNILSLYEDAYDDETAIENSKLLEDDKIYFLSSNKIKEKHLSISTDGYDEENHLFGLEVWKDSGIYFNTNYHCFVYDLDKLDFSLILESTINEPTRIFDWECRCWEFESLAKNFITVFDALRSYSNVLSNIQNNYIVLKQLRPNITTKWVNGGNSNGPGIYGIDFGTRGLCKISNSYSNGQENSDLANSLANRVSSIITNYEHKYLKDLGYYETVNNG